MVTADVVRRSFAIGFSIGGFLIARTVASAPPEDPCRASIELNPPRATLGQQVVALVRVARDDTVVDFAWDEDTAFADFRVVHLPDSHPERRVSEKGIPFRIREERRALFPNRVGEFRIGPSTVRCTFQDDGERRTVDFAAPAANLEVVEAPRTGRPDEFHGAIGPVELHAVAVPRQVSLGESIRLAVMVRGEGDLWNLQDPLPEIEAAEVFRRRPEITVETGPRLSVVRHFSYDVVPRNEGDLILPEIRLTTFDPVTGRFEIATSDSLRIAVTERRKGERRAKTLPGANESGEAPIEEVVERNAPARIRWLVVAAISLCMVGGGWAWTRRLRHRRRIAGLARALADELDTRARPAAVAEILRTAIRPEIPGSASMSAEEIVALPELSDELRDVADVLLRIERARFDPSFDAPANDEVIGVVKRL